MAVLTRLSLLALGVLLVSSLVLYGVNVHFSSQINDLGHQTREMNETNKELQVELNRTRAFQNVEASAAKLSHLHPPDEMIEVVSTGKALNTDAPESAPVNQQELPPVYGY